MKKTGKLCLIACASWFAAGCEALDAFCDDEAPPPPTPAVSARPPGPVLSPPTALTPPAIAVSQTGPTLPATPSVEPQDRPLPINLPAALQLAAARAPDIAAAAERL